MRLKYKVQRVEDSIKVSLDTRTEVIITPAMILDIKGKLNVSEKIMIGAAKNELHWQLTHKNMGLQDLISHMRSSLSEAVWEKDIDKKNTRIKNALNYMVNYFEAEIGVY